MEGKIKYTILIIEDMKENIDILYSLLKDHYNLKIAINGDKGLEIALKDPEIDLILLDIMMPGKSGFEVCEALKKNGRTQDIPVIFLTAKSTIEDITKGFHLGAMDYVTKPFNPIELQARVETHLKLKESMDKLKLINHEVGKAINESDAKVDFLVARIKKILKSRQDLNANYQKIQNFINLLAVNDLGNLKIVERILEKSDPIIDSIIKEPSPEEEYFRILSSSIEPLKTAISDIESTIRVLIMLGVVSSDGIKDTDVTKTSFYEILRKVYKSGKLSYEKFNELLEVAQFKLDTPDPEEEGEVMFF